MGCSASTGQTITMPKITNPTTSGVLRNHTETLSPPTDESLRWIENQLTRDLRIETNTGPMLVYVEDLEETMQSKQSLEPSIIEEFQDRLPRYGDATFDEPSLNIEIEKDIELETHSRELIKASLFSMLMEENHKLREKSPPKQKYSNGGDTQPSNVGRNTFK